MRISDWSSDVCSSDLDAGEVHVDDRLHRLPVGKLDVVEKAAPQKGVGQFLLVVRRDDDDRPLGRFHRLSGFVDMELHAVEFLQQVIRKLDVGLVDLVDQQHGQGGGGEGFPQLAAPAVIGAVVNALVAQLDVAKAGDGEIGRVRCGGGGWRGGGN